MSNPHEWHIASDKEGDLHEDFAKTISGHTTTKDIVRYTVAADQARLARNAMTRTVPPQPEPRSKKAQ